MEKETEAEMVLAMEKETEVEMVLAMAQEAAQDQVGIPVVKMELKR